MPEFLEAVLTIARALWWLGWYIFRTIGWTIGWIVCRVVTLGRLPSAGIRELDGVTRGIAVVVELVGLAVLSAIIWWLERRL